MHLRMEHDMAVYLRIFRFRLMSPSTNNVNVCGDRRLHGSLLLITRDKRVNTESKNVDCTEGLSLGCSRMLYLKYIN
ncbi:hypothetical protein HanRHA438_Chr03g0109601 [Helianthus annuus]|nr:hypothetical protein HanRHA438_Chr03g0109601 [Helianthus annuus]